MTIDRECFQKNGNATEYSEKELNHPFPHQYYCERGLVSRVD